MRVTGFGMSRHVMSLNIAVAFKRPWVQILTSIQANLKFCCDSSHGVISY